PDHVLTAVRELAEDVLSTLWFCHGAVIPDRRTQRSITTGVPAGVALNSRCRTSLWSRMQPFETAWPIDHGSFVPWIAIGPPFAQPVSTFEKAEMPIAAGPYGPPGSGGISRWLT